jgi:hypothetical protein
MDRAAGVWLDYLNANCRVTGNLFRNVVSCNGTLFVEVSHVANVLDRNVFWDIRSSPSRGINGKNGSAICADSSDHTIAAYNFFGRVEGFAVSMNNLQVDRIVEGRKGECRGNKVLNNVFFACPRRIFLGRNESNPCDGNLYDAGNVDAIFDIQDAAPKPKPRFDSWQQKFQQDPHSLAVSMEAALVEETGRLRFSCTAPPGTCLAVTELGEQQGGAFPGPFNADASKLLREGKPALWSPQP